MPTLLNRRSDYLNVDDSFCLKQKHVYLCLILIFNLNFNLNIYIWISFVVKKILSEAKSKKIKQDESGGIEIDKQYESVFDIHYLLFDTNGIIV